MNERNHTSMTKCVTRLQSLVRGTTLRRALQEVEAEYEELFCKVEEGMSSPHAICWTGDNGKLRWPEFCDHGDKVERNRRGKRFILAAKEVNSHIERHTSERAFDSKSRDPSENISGNLVEVKDECVQTSFSAGELSPQGPVTSFTPDSGPDFVSLSTFQSSGSALGSRLEAVPALAGDSVGYPSDEQEHAGCTVHFPESGPIPIQQSNNLLKPPGDVPVHLETSFPPFSENPGNRAGTREDVQVLVMSTDKHVPINSTVENVPEALSLRKCDNSHEHEDGMINVSKYMPERHLQVRGLFQSTGKRESTDCSREVQGESGKVKESEKQVESEHITEYRKTDRRNCFRENSLVSSKEEEGDGRGDSVENVEFPRGVADTPIELAGAHVDVPVEGAHVDVPVEGSHVDVSVEGAHVDVPVGLDRQELVRRKESVSLELLWIGQAIESRKAYLRLKEQLVNE